MYADDTCCIVVKMVLEHIFLTLHLLVTRTGLSYTLLFSW